MNALSEHERPLDLPAPLGENPAGLAEGGRMVEAREMMGAFF